jgi:hypothetical protein
VIRCKDCKFESVLAKFCTNPRYIIYNAAGDKEYYWTWAARKEGKCGSEAVGFEPSILYELKKVFFK